MASVSRATRCPSAVSTTSSNALGSSDCQLRAFEIGRDVIGGVQHGRVVRTAEPVRQIVGVMRNHDQPTTRCDSPRGGLHDMPARSAGTCR